jgi:superfamily II DNA or RNA helicase
MELIGCTGPLIFEKTVGELKQYLARPHVEMIHLPHTTNIYASDWPSIYQNGIVLNEQRNSIIIERAMRSFHLQEACLVFVNRIEHGLKLQELLTQEIGLHSFHTFISGQTPQSERDQIYQRLRSGSIYIVIAMDKVAGEGQDIPAVKRVVMACGGKGVIGVKQRTGRGMRPSGESEEEGWGGKVLIHDFVDNQHFRLSQQSAIRRATYISIEAVIEENRSGS